MSRKQKERNRELILAVKERLIQGLTERLSVANLSHRTKTQQARTGSVYVKIRVYDDNGRRLKGRGAAIRISDHRKQPGDQWVNFSRPAKRFYGVWCYNDPARIDHKAERIAAKIIRLNKIGGEA